MPSATTASPPLSIDDKSVPDLSKKLPPLISRRGPKSRPAQKTPQSPAPPPETPQLPSPPDANDVHSTHPTRRIISPHDLDLFHKSSTYTLIVSFIFTITDAVRDTPVSAVTTSKDSLHPTLQGVLAILDAIEDTVQECPPEDNGGSRFGNPAFRILITTLSSRLPSLQQERLSVSDSGAIDELSTYLLSSLGSPLRIDYGSGHELHFLIYLLCLYQLSLLPNSTFPAIALVVFPRYIRLMRNIQSLYYLEPAGSHGVWGLDDYHFLPFLFGASQLADHPFIRPLAIHSDATVEAYAPEYLYLDMVANVNATKTVQGLRWHSPMLDDISGVREGWGKICGGMKKMFVNEVVGKLVVMQHFLFGGFVPAVEGMSEESKDIDDITSRQEGEERVSEGHEGHAHNANSWGDCCGIKVPSSVGAVEEMRKRMGGGGGLRRLPFD